jgi:bacillithiol biosynthesis deacetylase BshB1
MWAAESRKSALEIRDKNSEKNTKIYSTHWDERKHAYLIENKESGTRLLDTILLHSRTSNGGPMKLDLLAIAPHPDDVELTCGGTMIKMAQAGYRTGIVDLTQGETGTRGTPETRLREAARAGKIMGVQVRRNLGLPDAHLHVCEEYKMAIAEVVRELEPHTVILPYWEGRHPDHYTAAILGYEACFIAGLKNYALSGEAFRPFKIIYAAAYANVIPTFAVDITKQYDRRKRAILAYESQFRPPLKEKQKKSKVVLPLDELEERMTLTAGSYGRMIGVKYAEGFVAKEILRIDDVVQMPVRSM